MRSDVLQKPLPQMDHNEPPPIPKPPFPPSQPSPATPVKENGEVTPGRATYNIISDTVIGVNFRGSDNKFQAVFLLWSIVIFTVLGTILVLLIPDWKTPWFVGAIAGAITGLLAGFLVSGMYLMIFRGARHIRGKHD